MEVYLIIAICIAASFGLYALMRRNQDKDAMPHLESYKEPAPLEAVSYTHLRAHET